MIAAAWLHDVLENTGVGACTLQELFGEEVARMVVELTNPSSPADGDRAARKAIDRAHVAAGSPDAQTIKVADVIDNARTVAVRDPAFARVYLPEKRELLVVLTRADPALLASAWRILDAYEVATLV